MNTSVSTSRLATVLGLAFGATGCAILWVAGAVPFPIPPGMVIMAAGALFVGWAHWRWAPAVGTLLGLLFAGGAQSDRPDEPTWRSGANGRARSGNRGSRHAHGPDRRSDRDVQRVPDPCRRKPVTVLLTLGVNAGG